MLFSMVDFSFGVVVGSGTLPQKESFITKAFGYISVERDIVLLFLKIKICFIDMHFVSK